MTSSESAGGMADRPWWIRAGSRTDVTSPLKIVDSDSTPDWMKGVSDQNLDHGKNWWLQPHARQVRAGIFERLGHSFPELGRLLGRDNFGAHLKRQNAASEQNPFPYSDGLDNPDLIDVDSKSKEITQAYFDELSEYQLGMSQVHPDKYDFDLDDINCGHKLHLNVPIAHVKEVSEHLIQNGYKHKYLSGGEVELGKIFTVYIGSCNLALKLAQEISRDLGGKLSRPVDRTESEYAPNVVGRFNASPKNRLFGRYGFSRVRGMSPLERFVAQFLWSKDTFDPEQVFNESYKALAREYGEYFYGKVT